ncbi:MAG: hypothetical protein M3Y65_20340 [Pseudomonadota bacterium]|nr:hypothetical protein [Pseudomonadota bacterium]
MRPPLIAENAIRNDRRAAFASCEGNSEKGASDALDSRTPGKAIRPGNVALKQPAAHELSAIIMFHRGNEFVRTEILSPQNILTFQPDDKTYAAFRRFNLSPLAKSGRAAKAHRPAHNFSAGMLLSHAGRAAWLESVDIARRSISR